MPSGLFALWVALYVLTVMIAYAFTRHAFLSLIVPLIFQGLVAALVNVLFTIGALP